jgi:MMPL family protein
MDYEVFLLSRVHEAWIETGDPHQAVAVGIGATARVITTAAAIMVVVFASFVLATDPTVKMLAIGMAFAVLIDASLVRMILVPSAMALLDERAWWMPRWLEPVVPHLQLEEGSATPASATEEPAGRPAAEEPDGSPVVTTATEAAADCGRGYARACGRSYARACGRRGRGQGCGQCGRQDPGRGYGQDPGRGYGQDPGRGCDRDGAAA